MNTVVLEPAAQELAEASSKPPFLYQMDPAAARRVLGEAQSAPIDKPPVDEEWITVPAAVGDVPVRIVKPQGAAGMLPVVVYMHGGGWVLGNAGTHDRLVRELAVGARTAVARPHRKRTTPSRSSRVTPPPSGSPVTARRRDLTPAGWPRPANRSAAT